MASGKHHARIVAQIEFADGEVRTVRPLSLKSLRKFAALVEGIEVSNEKPLDDETVDKMVEASQLILEKDYAELAKDKDRLEEVIDIDVFGKIMAVAMGTKLADQDPNE